MPPPQLGDRVNIYGLTGRCDLNGSQGIVIKCVPQRERWGVMIEGHLFSLRAENLQSHGELCSREQHLCALVMHRLYFGTLSDVTKHMLDFLAPAPSMVTLGIEVMPARSKAERGAIKTSHIAVPGGSRADEEHFLKNYYGWCNVRGLSMYSVHSEAASDYPDLFVYFDDASTGPTNEIITQACVGAVGWLAQLTGKCIRGSAVVLRQGQGCNNAVVQEFPMMAIMFPSEDKYTRNMTPAVPLTISQMLDTLVFFQDNEPIDWARMKESERMLRSSGTAIRPNMAQDAIGSDRIPFHSQYGSRTPCIVCGVVGCIPERHVGADVPDPEVIMEVQHQDSAMEEGLDPVADAEISALQSGTAMHAFTQDSGTLALVMTFARQPRQFDLALFRSAPGQLKEAAGEELQPSWAHGARNLVLGLTEEVWSNARPDLELNVRHVIVRMQDKDDVIAALRDLPCRKRPHLKSGVPVVPIADPAFTELFKDESDAEDHENLLVGTWQSMHGAYTIARNPNGSGIVFRETINMGEIGGALKRSAMGWWEAEVRFMIDVSGTGDNDDECEDEAEVLGLFRTRSEDDHGEVLLSQVLLAGSTSWADSEVVRSVRSAKSPAGEPNRNSTAECSSAVKIERALEDGSSSGEEDDLADVASALPSWGATLRSVVESSRTVHLHLEKNGIFLAGQDEEPVITPRSDFASSAPGQLEVVTQPDMISNPRIWSRRE
mmetsp:Transcript_26475/g.56204  ORF Transcript_26475/g.56204 Transcript_26475/m.56204 type:complete len:719 (+) Transcript_26475:73-2229(+)